MAYSPRAWFTLVLLLGAAIGQEGCAAPTAAHEDVNPSEGEALVMPPCGTVLASFDGTSAYSNGGDTATGASCAGDGAYGYEYQCVELVMRHFKTHWGLSWWGNANQLLVDAPAATVDVHPNGDGAHPPVPGDMIVWPNGADGHVALVSAVHASGIDVIEQNVKGDGTATLPWDGAHIGARWGSWIPTGWAHAKANGAQNTGGGGSGGAGGGSGGSGAGGAGGNGGAGGSTGGGWSCASSAYNGQQYWTCSGGDLHECQNGAPVEQTCSNGCTSNPVGTNDACNGSVSWSCANSAYNGQQYWTCSGGDLYECQNGSPVEQTCSNGCTSNPVGTNDTCNGSVSWSCANSAYNGQQYWTCSGGDLYECQSGSPVEQACSNGCTSNPVGTNDTCNGSVSWSCANSAYNGQQYWTCSGGDLYECQSGSPVEQTCSNGCTSNPVGTNDTCNGSVTWNCASSAYNGQQYWTCSGGDLYECQSGAPVEQTCANGCKSNPVGTNDVCL